MHGLVDGLSGDDAGGLELDTLALVGLDGAEAVDGVTEGVHDSAEHALTDGHIDDGAGSLDDITLLDLSKHRRGLSFAQEVRGPWPVAGLRDLFVRERGCMMRLTYRYQGRQYQHYQFPS